MTENQSILLETGAALKVAALQKAFSELSSAAVVHKLLPLPVEINTSLILASVFQSILWSTF